MEAVSMQKMSAKPETIMPSLLEQLREQADVERNTAPQRATTRVPLRTMSDCLAGALIAATAGDIGDRLLPGS